MAGKLGKGGKPQPKKEYVQEGSGRPTKFTPERCAAIINDVARRAPYQFAAEANGICADTLYEWLKIGKQHRRDRIESDYSLFSDNIKRAELSRIIEHNDNIADHVDKWQADAWILERRWHKHYGSNAPLNELNEKLDKLMENERHEKGSYQEGREEDDQEVGS